MVDDRNGRMEQQSYRTRRRNINKEACRISNEIKNTIDCNHPVDINLNINVENSSLCNDDISETALFRTHSIEFNSVVTDNTNQEDVAHPNLSVGLASWSVAHNITHNALSDLLKILKPHIPNERLPLDARTLLRTPRNITLKSVKGGKFYYFGMQSSILKYCCQGLNNFRFPCMSKYDETFLTISINTDGIPICKSSNTQLWPILVRLDQSNLPPFVAGIFCGETKPGSIIEYLSEFVNEAKLLEDVGLNVHGKKYCIRISCVIADSPARALVKCIKGHTGYHSCERCEDEGDWDRRMLYSHKLTCQSRSDNSFILQTDKDHHVGVSPLVDLKLGLVSQFVLDYMHLVCLGIMRKLLYLWVSGPLETRLSAKLVREISAYLVSISKTFPSEFSRKPRSLKDLNKFKATEFRQFLLYTGPCALKGILDKEKFRHFLYLHCAMKLLLSDFAQKTNYNFLAKTLLCKFVEKMYLIYGPQTIVYNVHNLLHLADDGLKYGNLDNVSAFPFESYLYRLKQMIRGQKLQVEQIVRRIYESNELVTKVGKSKSMTVSVSAKEGNNFYLTQDRKIAKIIKINAGQKFLTCDLYETMPISEYPICSNLVASYFVGKRIMKHVKVNFECSLVKCVVVPEKLNGKNLCSFPLLLN